MKTTKTITIDYEVWNELLLKTNNCSGTINKLIKDYIEITPNINETNKLKVDIIKLQAELGKKNEEIKKIETEKTKTKPSFVWNNNL